MAHRAAYNPYNPFNVREHRPDPIPVRPQAPPPPMDNDTGITFDVFPDRSRSRSRSSRHRRRNYHHHRVPLFPPFPGARGWASDTESYDNSEDSDYPYYTSDDDAVSPCPYHHGHGRRRDRHRHIHLPVDLPLALPHNVVVRRPPAAAAPRNYGYRRLHYQGGRARRWTRGHSCVPTRHNRRHCGGAAEAREPQRNILVRCGRWLFGDSRRCVCGRGCSGVGAGRCCGQEERSRSPTRHREEEYWGPGTQVG